MKKLFQRLGLIGLIVIVLLAAVQGLRTTALRQVNVHQNNIPTILLHGAGGTILSLGPMALRFNLYHIATVAMKITVDHNQTIHYQQYRPLRNNPEIIVILKNKYDAEAGTKALTKIMQHLYTKNHVRQVNFVGHSMGGGIMLTYLLHATKNAPTVHKFVSLATPYMGFDANEGPNNPRYQAMLKSRKNLPRTLQVFNLVGNVKHRGNDAQVSTRSAAGLRKIVAGQIDRYIYHEFPGNFLTASHFMIHENPQVDVLIARFLWS
ncbi:alpha/beta fold hydrolase [Agrilactobacillus fermenti]|uniref:alpha/beta fold hydrolase n=1 Tax=Agrilactobacillus fermenti TaxID=2586909 RepID=UPI003A5B9902